MPYFVIKGPRGGHYYLCSVPGFSCPQWLPERSKASRFPDEDSAWKYLVQVAKEDPARDIMGRAVRVNTSRDWKAERERLLGEVALYRMVNNTLRADINRLRGTSETWSEGAK